MSLRIYHPQTYVGGVATTQKGFTIEILDILTVTYVCKRDKDYLFIYPS